MELVQGVEHAKAKILNATTSNPVLNADHRKGSDQESGQLPIRHLWTSHLFHNLLRLPRPLLIWSNRQKDRLGPDIRTMTQTLSTRQQALLPERGLTDIEIEMRRKLNRRNRRRRGSDRGRR